MNEIGGTSMLQAQHTPNMTGVLLSGDPEDFRALYDALHMIIGDAGDEVEDRPAIRVLGVCYDIRHAFMGTETQDTRNTVLMMKGWYFYRSLDRSKTYLFPLKRCGQKCSMSYFL